MTTASIRRLAGLAAALLLVGVPAAGAPLANKLCMLHMRTAAASTTSHSAADAGAATPLAIGRGTTLTLAPIATIHFPATPGKTGGPYGGLFFVDVPRAGTYRISIGARAWIDVAEGATSIASLAHAHGKACSGVAKEVTFPLTAGRHAVEVTASDAPALALTIAPAG